MAVKWLLLQLMQVNEKLTEYSRIQAGGANATMLHSLQRHWDILQDYSHEFHKIRTNVHAVREREKLLEVVNRDRFITVFLKCIVWVMIEKWQKELLLLWFWNYYTWFALVSQKTVSVFPQFHCCQLFVTNWFSRKNKFRSMEKKDLLLVSCLVVCPLIYSISCLSVTKNCII